MGVFTTVLRLLRELNRMRSSDGRPDIKQLFLHMRDLEVIKLNIKNLGYQLGRTMQPYLDNIPCADQPARWNLVSKACTQEDVESPWFRYWCKELKIAPIYHRKLWEFAFLLQSLYDQDLLIPGKRGIGFGCGKEPLASYFASKGIDVLVTDLELERVRGAGWIETGQHASSLESSFHSELCSRELFNRHVRHAYVDMNAIPSDYQGGFDFCWSVCAMEHLGSIRQGLDFVNNSMKVLKPGGVAIHTTEYNYLASESTVDNVSTVLFLRRHFEEMAQRLNRAGHLCFGPSFEIGNGVLDRFIDLPPYALDEGLIRKEQWSEVNQLAHLKLAIEGYACTCFGILVKKGSHTG
jgi:2-polyprenyl-3-methyl-5-hydroxy-6-metoxy-1,4-benzoquinol methylase